MSNTRTITSNFRGHPTRKELLNFWAREKFQDESYVLIIKKPTTTEEINIILKSMANKHVSYDKGSITKSKHYFLPFNNLATCKQFAAFIYDKGYDSRITSHGESIPFNPANHERRDFNDQEN